MPEEPQPQVLACTLCRRNPDFGRRLSFVPKLWRKSKRGWASRPSPGRVPESSPRLEVEAQPELDESRRVVLVAEQAKVATADVHVRIIEHHVVEHVGHLAVEPRAHPLRDFGRLGDAEVHVPAVEPAQITAARSAVDCQIGRSKEREAALRVVEHIIRIGIRSQLPGVVVYRGALVLAADREVGAAIAKHNALPELLATRSVENIQRQASGKYPYSRYVPSANDLVHHSAAGREALPASEWQIIGKQCRKRVP